MRVSQNEYTSLLKQAFEGCGMHTGAYESAAEMMVWAHMHNLDAFTSIEQTLQQCLELQSAKIELLQQDDQSCTIDVNQGSALLWGALATDLALASANRSGICVLRILNGQNFLLLLSRLAKTSLHCLLYTLDQQNSERLCIACIAAGQGCPDVTIVDLPVGLEIDAASAVIVLASDADMVQSHLDQFSGLGSSSVSHTLSAKQLHEDYLECLQNGIEVADELYRNLLSLADRVLVESSEQSRMGAGA